MSTTILQVNQLSVSFRGSDRRAASTSAVQQICFELSQGQTLGIVGESGSGKSATALALMGLLGSTALSTGEVWFNSGTAEQVNLLTVPSQKMRNYRGSQLAMIFQEPMTSLNPLFSCGYQIIEVIRQHTKGSESEARAIAMQLFTEVKLPNPEQILQRYPHELSGGQLQRVMMAIAISGNPTLLIADEPTTALDVTVQAAILALLRQIQSDRQMSMIFITHDLGVISQVADQVAVMRQGKIVEAGNTQALFQNPQHPYTKGLIACRPQPQLRLRYLPTVSDFLLEQDGEILAQTPQGDRFTETISPEQAAQRQQQLEQNPPILKIENLRVEFPVRGILGNTERYAVAVQDVSFEVYQGETLGLVGESGCGKTSLSRAILRLIPTSGGKIWFEQQEITNRTGRSLRQLRRDLQIIFQDPYSSLNPRMKVAEAIAEPLEIHQSSQHFVTKKSRQERVNYLLERVGLDKTAGDHYPHEFSGGQRQRLCIARALALNPKLIIADEPVSALDVSVQAQVLNLLKELQAEFGLTYIFISHDLSVVKFMSDRIAIMNQGKIEEIGSAEMIYTQPTKAYTQSLIDAIPKMSFV